MEPSRHQYEEITCLLTSTHRSHHPAVNSIIQSIKQQGVEYCLALDSSIETVETGYAFCEDAEDLCKYLLESAYPRRAPGICFFHETHGGKSSRGYEGNEREISESSSESDAGCVFLHNHRHV